MSKKNDYQESAPVASVPDAVDLQAKIAACEATLADLRAQLALAEKQHYPKVRYHATEAPVTVCDATAEAEAAQDGWTLDAPAKVGQ